MDVHGHDISSFELLPTHSQDRLPTVSAAQANQGLDGNAPRLLSTGLKNLDKLLLVDDASDAGQRNTPCGGIRRGHVTEIWGPPGAGKTTLGIQLSRNAVREGGGVVWVDGFYPVCSRRVASIVGQEAGEAAGGASSQEGLSRFVQYTALTLPHLIALLCRPTRSCIPDGTSLLVIDSLSSLVNHNFPNISGSKNTPGGGKASPSASARRIRVLQCIIDALQKLASTRDVAVVVLTQCASRMQAERGAAVVPSISTSAWEQGVSTRFVLFRDWGMQQGGMVGLHVAAIQKANGKVRSYGSGSDGATTFKVELSGLVAVDAGPSQRSVGLATTPAQKRKLRDTDFEVADSEDEDYGWRDEDGDAVPPMPSQWQGSEDLLLGQRTEGGDEESQDQDDEDDDNNGDEEGGDLSGSEGDGETSTAAEGVAEETARDNAGWAGGEL